MPATTKERRIAGPASSAATWPVITKMPEPMMAPAPREVSPIGPRMRRRRFSPTISACNISSDFVANRRFQNIPILLPSPPPQPEHRYARQDDDEAGPAIHRLDDQQTEHDDRAQGDVNGRQHGIADGTIGPGPVRPFSPQYKQRSDRDHVEKQGGEYHIIQQLDVAA